MVIVKEAKTKKKKETALGARIRDLSKLIRNSTAKVKLFKLNAMYNNPVLGILGMDFQTMQQVIDDGAKENKIETNVYFILAGARMAHTLGTITAIQSKQQEMRLAATRVAYKVKMKENTDKYGNHNTD